MGKRKKRAKKKVDLRRDPAHRGIRWHQNEVFDPLRYTVLTSSQMSKADKETVRAQMQVIVSGPEAMTLPKEKNGWACEQVSNGHRQVLVVKYKGIEVALFYKRQLTEIEPQSESPGYHPEGVLQDPIEAWQRLDLLGPSAKKENLALKSMHDRLVEENRLLYTRVGALDRLVETYTEEITGLGLTVTTLQAKLRARSGPKPPEPVQSPGKTPPKARKPRFVPPTKRIMHGRKGAKR